MWAPDVVLDLLSGCLQVMVSIDRLAEELQLWTTEPFAFVEIGDDQSRTSVVMPHKKNPYSLTYLRGAARHALGTVTGVSATLMTATGQPDNRTFAYGEVPRLLKTTTDSCGLLAAVVRDARFSTEQMERAAGGFTASTELCDVMSLHGIENRIGHGVVGTAVRIAIEAGRDHLEYDDLRTAADRVGIELPFGGDEMASIVDPRRQLERRVTEGGAGADQIASMISAQRATALEHRAEVDDHSSHGFGERLVREVRQRSRRDDGE